MQYPDYPSDETHYIVDPQHGMQAYVYTLPPGWEASSMLLWNLQNTNNLVLIFGQFWNPAGGETLELFPNEHYYWLKYNMGIPDRPGSLSLPASTPAASALLHYVIPRYRAGCQDLKILNVFDLPHLAQQLNLHQMVQLNARGISATIQYKYQGYTLHEQFFALKYVLAPTYGQQNWGLYNIFSLRSLPQFSMARNVGFQIVASRQENSKWLHLCGQIAQQLNAQQGQALAMQQQTLQQMQQQEQAALHNYLNWSHQTQQGVVNARWYSDARRTEQFGDALMGRNAYVDPVSQYGNPYHDYSHAKYVFTDSQGSWLYSDDPNFDPNVNSQRSWTRAQPYQ